MKGLPVTSSRLPEMVGDIADTLAARGEVHAIALGGSRSGSLADPQSDYDIYVFVDDDVMYWHRDDFERDLRDVIEQYRPSLGYSTAFWYTVRQAMPLYDQGSWFACLQTLAARPYPDALREAIVYWNHLLLRTTHSSYRYQIGLAIA